MPMDAICADIDMNAKGFLSIHPIREITITYKAGTVNLFTIVIYALPSVNTLPS